MEEKGTGTGRCLISHEKIKDNYKPPWRKVSSIAAESCLELMAKKLDLNEILSGDENYETGAVDVLPRKVGPSSGRR